MSTYLCPTYIQSSSHEYPAIDPVLFSIELTRSCELILRELALLLNTRDRTSRFYTRLRKKMEILKKEDNGHVDCKICTIQFSWGLVWAWLWSWDHSRPQQFLVAMPRRGLDVSWQGETTHDKLEKPPCLESTYLDNFDSRRLIPESQIIIYRPSTPWIKHQMFGPFCTSEK